VIKKLDASKNFNVVTKSTWSAELLFNTKPRKIDRDSFKQWTFTF